jgi:large subunit ribosomal protein L32e
MTRRFLRSETHRFSRLGKGRPKLQKWRRPRGKHNKTRLNRFSYPVQPGIGFGTPRKDSGKVAGLYPILISNPSDVSKLTKTNIAIISRRIGAKKKLEIIKRLSESNIKISNLGGKK